MIVHVPNPSGDIPTQFEVDRARMKWRLITDVNLSLAEGHGRVMASALLQQIGPIRSLKDRGGWMQRAFIDDAIAIGSRRQMEEVPTQCAKAVKIEQFSAPA